MRLSVKTGRLVSAVLIFACISNAVNAASVTLQAHDKSMSVSGELTSFDGLIYTIKSNLGDVEIDASMVTCTGDGCPVTLDEGKFSIAGSNEFGTGLMPSLIDYFALVNDMNAIEALDADPLETIFNLESNIDETAVEISIFSNGTDLALDALSNRTAAIGMVSNTPNFKNSATPKLISSNPLDINNTNLIALDAIAIVVSPKNPIDSLSLDQLARIFSGEIVNWNEIGGLDGEISVHALNSTLKLSHFFTDSVLIPANETITSAATTFNDNRQLSMAVARDKNAIGFVSYAFSNGTKVLSMRGNCGIEVKPTPFTLKTQEYPFSQQLHLIHASGPQTEMTEKFLEFVHSDEAKIAIQYAGFVDTVIAEQGNIGRWERLVNAIYATPENATAVDFKEFISDFRYARRLSSTFRFNFTDAKLNPQNQHEITHLAQYIRANYTANMEVLVAGFTSAEGPASANTAVSARGAQMVAKQLTQELNGSGISVSSAGYGELSPLICSDNIHNKRTNQRVEIWVRLPM